MPLSAEPTHLSRLADKLRAKILTLALQGKLTRGNHHWIQSTLDDIFDIARGGSPRPIKAYITTAADGLNWIKIGDAVKGSKYITSVHEKIKPEGLHKTRRVYKGDLILSNSMSYGQPYILAIDGCIHDGWLVLHPKKEVSRDFFVYLLSSDLVRRQFATLAAGGVVENLNSDKVRSVKISYPPSLAEQEEIVGKVEALLAEVDHIREAEKIISLCASRLRASILQNALQGKLSNGNHHWIQSTLGEVCDLLSGRDLEPKAYNSQGDGIPYITGASNIDDGRVIINRWTTAPITIAEKGSLLLTCKGTIGKLAFLQEPKAHIARQIMAITSKGDVSLDYIRLAVLVSIYDLQAKAKSFIPGIDRSTVLGLPISYPPSLAEQEEIVGKVEALLAEVDHLTTK